MSPAGDGSACGATADPDTAGAGAASDADVVFGADAATAAEAASVRDAGAVEWHAHSASAPKPNCLRKTHRKRTNQHEPIPPVRQVMQPETVR